MFTAKKIEFADPSRSPSDPNTLFFDIYDPDHRLEIQSRQVPVGTMYGESDFNNFYYYSDGGHLKLEFSDYLIKHTLQKENLRSTIPPVQKNEVYSWPRLTDQYGHIIDTIDILPVMYQNVNITQEAAKVSGVHQPVAGTELFVDSTYPYT